MTLRHDYLDDKAANYRLCQTIRDWWHKRGHRVRVRLEKVKDPQGSGSIFVVRVDAPQHVRNLELGHSVD